MRSLRRAWQRLDRQCQEILQHPIPGTEIEAITNLPPGRVHGSFRLFQNRALLGILAVLGVRIDALAHLRLCDCLEKYIDPDGRIGPAVSLMVGKTYDDKEQLVMKPIPEGLWLVIEQARLMTERFFAMPDPRREPLFPPFPGAWPLFIGSRARPGKFMNRTSLARRLSGHSSKRGQPRQDQAALVPFDPDAIELEAADRTPEQMLGFSPHRFRALAMQTVKNYGAGVLRRARNPR